MWLFRTMTSLFDQRSIFRAGSQDWQQICQENVPMKYSICSSQRICWQRYFAWLTFTFLMRKHMLLPRQDGSDLLCCACCRITNRLLGCQWDSKTPRLLWFLPSQLHFKHLFALLLKEYNFPKFSLWKKYFHCWGRRGKTGRLLSPGNDCTAPGNNWVRKKWGTLEVHLRRR